LKNYLSSYVTPAVFFAMLVSIFFVIGGVPYYFLAGADEIEHDIPVPQKQTDEYTKTNIIEALKNCGNTLEANRSFNNEKRCREAAENLNNYIKNKRELNAQEGMWRAATELLRITAVQLFFLIMSTLVSFLAVLLVYKTFKETEATNKGADHSRKMELRPYVAITNPTVNRFILKTRSFSALLSSWNTNRNRYKVAVVLKNEGKTPIYCTIFESRSLIFQVCKKTLRSIPVDSYYSQETISSGVNSTPINPNAERELSLVLGQDGFTSPYIQKDTETCFRLDAVIRFKDLSTEPNKHRCIWIRMNTLHFPEQDVQVLAETTEDDQNRFASFYSNTKKTPFDYFNTI
jgi:hypothetical protein